MPPTISFAALFQIRPVRWKCGCPFKCWIAQSQRTNSSCLGQNQLETRKDRHQYSGSRHCSTPVQGPSVVVVSGPFWQQFDATTNWLDPRFLSAFEASSIKVLSADQEFIGDEWMTYPIENNVPFFIRVCEDMHIEFKDGSQAQFRLLLRKRCRGGGLVDCPVWPARRKIYCASRGKRLT